METHGLPLAWHPMALPAYTPNVPTASYSPYLPSFQAPVSTEKKTFALSFSAS